MRYGYMRVIFVCNNTDSFNKYASALYSIGVYDIVMGYDPAAIDNAILFPKTDKPDILMSEKPCDTEIHYPNRQFCE